MASTFSHVAQVRISARKNKLAELVKVKQTVLCAIVLSDDVISIANSWVQVLLAHEIVQLCARNAAIVVDVQVLEQTHWLEVGVARQVLSSQLNL